MIVIKLGIFNYYYEKIDQESVNEHALGVDLHHLQSPTEEPTEQSR